VAPLTHAAGLYLLPCYLRGGRSVISSRFDAEAVLRDIEEHRITQLMLVPTMISRLLDALDSGARVDLSSLRVIHYGTAPASVELLRRAVKRFGPILRQAYGMTEAPQPLAVLYPHEHVVDGSPRETARLKSCGKPTMNVTITIRGPDEQELRTGEVGEIAIAHRGVGEVQFWRRPEVAAQSVRNGWYYTGDLGYFDEDGFLYIAGRSKDMIISGGFNVYAREVEDALETHPRVLQAAVVGIPDPEWGELVAAFVVPRQGGRPTAEELVAHCAARIAGYKKPRLVRILEDLPRNAAGKVMKSTLRDEFMAVARP
jgi:acyl-CoA synthetase (AMP-forming)/AMP-acid ligase II